MSNKTTLQSNNTRLNTNNIDLASILQKINNLPAGETEVSLQEKTIDPKTTIQYIIADTGYNGLSKVKVNAVTSSIDSDIKAANIKKGINILGVVGTLETKKEEQPKSITITENGIQTVTPDDDKVLSSVSITTNVSLGTTETWTFTMEDDTTITKEVVVG